MSFDLYALKCPVSLDFFKNAQKLNCPSEHSLDLEFARKLFGEILPNNQCNNPGPCPLCRERV